MLVSNLCVAAATWIACALAAPNQLFQARQNGLKFPYGDQKVRGVNLGGWLLLEPWITPSLFDALDGAAVDEYTFCAALGPGEAHNRLSNHWNSFITRDDFSAIAAAGLNHVRIPVGYWSVIPDGTPYVQGAYEVLGIALDWAQETGLKVMIDLHGAPGSQNGFDNSGQRDKITWGQGDTVRKTLEVLAKIRDDHARNPVVASIELVNEPMPSSVSMDTIKSFYDAGWESLKDSGAAVVIQDAFQTPLSSWNSYGGHQQNVILDTHQYQVFTNGLLGMNINEHVDAACALSGEMTGVSGKHVIAGEWCGAMTDCTKWLNGYGRGARFDGSFQSNYEGGTYIGSCAGLTSGSVAQLPGNQKWEMRRYIEAQLQSFENADGWVWWTWKTEGAPGWDLGDLIANGVFPQPIDSRSFPC